jgi:hypothetical protein
MIKIYAIINPMTGDPVYVGQTVKTLGRRLSNHLLSAKTKNTAIHVWIKSILDNGGKPGIKLIKEVDNKEGDYWESYYISLYNSQGFSLYNNFSGGKLNQKVIKDFDRNITTEVQIVILDENNNLLSIEKSIAEVQRKLNIDREKIREVLVGKRNQGNNVWKTVHSYKGYVFVYKDKYDPNKDYTVQRRLINRGRINRVLQQYDLENNLISEYISTLEAEKITNVGSSEISRCCTGKGKTAGGYIWKYKII